MKLWLKVSLIAIVMVALSTSVCSLLMLIRAGRSNLELAIRYALTDQAVRAASWQNAMEGEWNDALTAPAQRSLARYLMDKFADDNTILMQGDDHIYNCTGLDPRSYLPLTGSARQYVIEDVNGASLLFVGKHIAWKDTGYQLYRVEDISSVYTGIRGDAYRFALINSAVILLSAAVVMLLLRLALRPIGTLKKNTGLIAKGIYDRRIEIAEHDEIGELAADFNAMAGAVQSHVRELQEEARRRTWLLTALTHELKTPMTGISGNAQTLLATKLTEEEREDALIRINEEVKRVERLSQKLMQLILLRQDDALQLQPERVQSLLDAVKASCAAQLKQRGLTLALSNDMDTLPVERDLLVSLLINLVDNAGKASKPGDTITLCAAEGTIAVRDHGRGIARDELDKITQPFYMVDKSRAKKAGGVGLGLALCEEIARLHGARLEFTSELGHGTCAKVVFHHEEAME